MKRRELLPFQKRAVVRYAKSNWAFFAMEMRLGKTITTIRWVDCVAGLNCNVLVVAPLSTLPGWERELTLEGHRSCILLGNPEARYNEVEKAKHYGVRWFLVNREGMRIGGNKTATGRAIATPSILAYLKWDVVICDESTTIRNPQAQITKIFQRYLSRVKYKACLSGLPAPENTLDVFEQMRWLRGGFLGYNDYWKAREGLFLQIPGHSWEWVPKRGTNKRIREAFREHAFVLSRHEAGLAVKPIYQTLTCVLPSRIRKAYDKAENEFELDGKWTKWVPVMHGWLASLCGGRPKDKEKFWSDHKLKLLIDVLKGEVGHELAKEQVVVWFRYNAELFAARDALRTAGIACDTLTGSTPFERRKRIEEEFANKRFRIFLGQVGCGKFGLNLSCASVVVWYSYTYEFEAHKQASERTEHIEKKEPTLHIRLVCKNTVDEDVVIAQSEKNLRSKMFMRNLTKEFKKRWEQNNNDRTKTNMVAGRRR